MMDLSAALDKYYEKFGENYPLCISACREDAEIIAEIELFGQQFLVVLKS